MAKLTRLIRLTRPDNQPVWLNASTIERISAVIEGEASAGARTSVASGGSQQFVIESPEDVVRAVEAADG